MADFVQQSRLVVESTFTGALLVSEPSDLPRQFLDKDRIVQACQWELAKFYLLSPTLISFSNQTGPDFIKGVF